MLERERYMLLELYNPFNVFKNDNLVCQLDQTPRYLVIGLNVILDMLLRAFVKRLAFELE